MRLWMRDGARTESNWNTFKRSTPSSFSTSFHHQYPWQGETRPNWVWRGGELDMWSLFWTKDVTNELQKRAAHWIWGVFMYFVSPYIFCEGVPSLHSHTSGLSWSGPNYHSSNRPALPYPTLPAIEHPPFFCLYKLWNWRKTRREGYTNWTTLNHHFHKHFKLCNLMILTKMRTMTMIMVMVILMFMMMKKITNHKYQIPNTKYYHDWLLL